MADGTNRSARSLPTAGPLRLAETQARGADRKEEGIGRVARPVADQEGDDRRHGDAAQARPGRTPRTRSSPRRAPPATSRSLRCRARRSARCVARSRPTSCPHFAQSRRPSPSCGITLPRWPFPLHRRLNLRSGVGAAVDRQVRTVDERRLRTGDERYKRCDLVGVSIPIKRNDRLLAYGPVA